MILEKHQLLQGIIFMANVEELTGRFREQHHVFFQVSCCKRIAVTSGLAWICAGTCSCMQTSAAGTLGGIFEIIDATGVQVQVVYI